MAPTVVALSLALRAMLLPILHEDTVFLYFVPAVLISAGIGGLGPGLLATALSVVAAVFVISGSANPFDTAVIVNGLAFTLIGTALEEILDPRLRERRR